MTALAERDLPSQLLKGNSIDITDKNKVSTDSEDRSSQRCTKSISWSSFSASAFSIFEIQPSSTKKECSTTGEDGWVITTVKRIVSGRPMRRFQERILGTCKADVASSGSEVWVLGSCYKVSPEDSSDAENGLTAFWDDFSSRIWITYRKGFNAISDSKFTSDVNWGCMIRCSQMLVAQAMLFQHLGRSWRKPSQKQYDPKYIEILHHFGDSEVSAFSIHNLLEAGRNYGLSAGCWVGPYAMCQTWASLARVNKENVDRGSVLPMSIYVVSGDEDGERGGAPVIYINVAGRLCSNYGSDESTWEPILLLVPLVLGLDKVNPRYIPLLCETFSFPQSLGILGGKPGASTYIIGVQDNKALYLDPHEVQMVVDIKRDNLEADTTSYHCSRTPRSMLLCDIDPSLAIGFYCHDKNDFEDLCSRASGLAERSSGAPLFTVSQSTEQASRPLSFDGKCMEDGFDADSFSEGENQNQEEDDWQIL